MKYSVRWEEKSVVVSFSGDLNMQDINYANEALNSDERYEKCKYSVWDLRNCNTENINVDEIYTVVALDVGSSMYPALKAHKLALIADEPNTIMICKHYMSEMEGETEWSIKLFNSQEEKIMTEWCNA